jgi:diguanylate cyclase (GGDEF)-like protein
LLPLWRANVLACCDIVGLLSSTVSVELAAVQSSIEHYRTVLEDGADIEALPLLDAALALAYERAGDRAAALAASGRSLAPRSFAAGARSFPHWVRAQLAVAGLDDHVIAVQREYAQLVSQMRWQSREAVLAAARAQISVERRKADHDRLHHAVQTDPLTGLRNRRVFDLWLQDGRVQAGGRTALMLLDLDGFKAINDTFGHRCGDEVLRRVGRLMRELSRAGDLAIRHGGDEFALILREEQLVEEAVAARADRLAAAIAAEPWDSLYEGLAVSVSIGLACGTIRADASVHADGELLDAEQLYLAADSALYESKRGGRAVTVAERAQAARS